MNLGNIITDTTMIDEGPRGLLERDWQSFPHGSIAYASPMDMEVMTRKEIVERVRMAEADGSTLRGLCAEQGVNPMYQAQTLLCWANGTTHLVHVVRAMQGQPFIKLSAASVAGPITGYRNVGGYGIRAVQQLRNVGAAPDSMWPTNDISRKWETPEVEQARPMFRVLDWYDAINGKQMDGEERLLRLATLLVRKKPCSGAYNWMGHLVTPLDVVIVPGTKDQLGIFCHNSGYGRDQYGFTTLTGTRAIPDEVLAVRSVVASLVA